MLQKVWGKLPDVSVDNGSPLVAICRVALNPSLLPSIFRVVHVGIFFHIFHYLE